MIRLYKYFIPFLLLSAVVSCDKKDLVTFDGEDSLRFDYNTITNTRADSLTYSFRLQLNPMLTSDTIWLKVDVVGNIDPTNDRAFKLKHLEGTTGIENTDFKFIDWKIQKDSFSTWYPVIIYRKAALKDETIRLVVGIQSNESFKDGPTGTLNIPSSNNQKFTIIFNDKISKPDYWMYTQYQYGDYSDRKFEFMIAVLGVTNFMPDHMGGPVDYATSINYQGMMIAALQDYELLHGPMLDENNNRVEFPL